MLDVIFTPSEAIASGITIMTAPKCAFGWATVTFTVMGTTAQVIGAVNSDGTIKLVWGATLEANKDYFVRALYPYVS